MKTSEMRAGHWMLAWTMFLSIIREREKRLHTRKLVTARGKQDHQIYYTVADCFLKGNLVLEEIMLTQRAGSWLSFFWKSESQQYRVREGAQRLLQPPVPLGQGPVNIFFPISSMKQDLWCKNQEDEEGEMDGNLGSKCRRQEATVEQKLILISEERNQMGIQDTTVQQKRR